LAICNDRQKQITNIKTKENLIPKNIFKTKFEAKFLPDVAPPDVNLNVKIGGGG
jgi:hypothetical protein